MDALEAERRKPTAHPRRGGSRRQFLSHAGQAPRPKCGLRVGLGEDWRSRMTPTVVLAALVVDGVARACVGVPGAAA
jgi:hypothetical protein